MCVLITVDVKNAFNTASWRLIVQKLENKGISTYLIRLVDSYLKDRTVILRDSENRSEEMKISQGVPQGSVIGPMLWNILYDGVLEVPRGTKLIAFADDLAIVVSTRTENGLIGAANHILG